MADQDDTQAGATSVSSGGDTRIGGDVVGRDKVVNIYHGASPASTNSQEFSSDRRRAYEQLWAMLEDIHVRIRTDAMGQRDFNDNVTQVNSFLLRNSLYIDKVHASLATQYLDNVFKLSHLVAQSRDKRAANSWHSTAALPTNALREHEELKAAWKAVDESRDQLISDFRQVLQAGGG